MARKNQAKSSSPSPPSQDKSEIAAKLKKKHANTKSESFDAKKLALIPITIVLAIAVSWYYQFSLVNQVNTPINEPKMVNTSNYLEGGNLDRYWGTYRPNLYFGLKTRSEKSSLVGMMWFNQYSNQFQIRHWCDQGDRLVKYGWTAHDGRNFGMHDIYESFENSFSIRNSWAKRLGGEYGGEWTVKTEVSQFANEQTPKFVSVIFYFAQNETGWLKSIQKNTRTVIGETEDLGKFKVKLNTIGDNKNVFIDMANGNTQVTYIKESLLQNQYFTRKTLKSEAIKEYVALKGLDSDVYDSSNFVAIQVSGIAPFTFELAFESESYANEYKAKYGTEPKEFTGTEFEGTLQRLHGDFQNRFEKIFKLREKKLPGNAIMMAQAALSNLVGGIGFFTGKSIVKSIHSKVPVFYWDSNLYTAVPSRSFFPRGFLWDEGFHEILVSTWDAEISRDVISHWLDLMNVEGWIPREVILGEEALARVPQEFWIQNHQYANPPALFLPLQKLIEKMSENTNAEVKSKDLDFLRKAFPRLKKWYNWFNTTQIGKLPFTYHWRGRNAETIKELNPKTLTSGLDDYPRASHPTDDERHLDLRCWMAFASKVMAEIAEIIGNTNDKQAYHNHYLTLSDNRLLDELHWSGTQYADYGLHSDNIKLVRPPPKPQQPNMPPPPQEDMIRKVETKETYQYINSVGYVSLFPMLLQILKPDSPKLEIMLNQIKDPQLLWTKYGLRSLAKSAPLYNKRNTEHDPPYWRGAVWININYLTLKSLKYYATVDGPYKSKALAVHNELKEAITNNILENYGQTGYIWEQYNDNTGKGQGSHPFTGWSALVSLIYAEMY